MFINVLSSYNRNCRETGKQYKCNAVYEIKNSNPLKSLTHPEYMTESFKLKGKLKRKLSKYNAKRRIKKKFK